MMAAGLLVDLLHKVRKGEVGQETDLVVGLAVARWNEDRMAEEGGKLELDTTMSKGGNWSTNLCCWRVGARCRAGLRLVSRTRVRSPVTWVASDLLGELAELTWLDGAGEGEKQLPLSPNYPADTVIMRRAGCHDL